ncbi:nudix hydrolase chloroplastic-like [Trifolium pratense]|uniref:Nudix hydrolase chloroplastic-like n=1 Tax=Trifolium pratense TaxID=57577 RepID=A0A2K3MPE8_TRIPR|nr:nudix hydrolase chloroplastic-like [Trifolium pratense]
MMLMSCKFSSSLSPSHNFPSFSVSATAGTCKLTWDHVLHISESKHVTQQEDPSSYLQGYFHKVQLCNRGSDKQSEFLPFVIEGHVVGFIHNRFVEHLRRFNNVFVFTNDGGPVGDCVSLHPLLKTAEERTSAVAYVIEHLGEKYIPHIRNELYPVKSSFDKPTFFSLERAAAPYFGIKLRLVVFDHSSSYPPCFHSAISSVLILGSERNLLASRAYAIHMSGYVELDGEKHLWIAKRSHSKSTYPGLLDHLVAGGLPYGIDCRENVVKECEEEAGIPRSISIKAKPVGAISYMDIDGYRYQRYVVFSYDLILPESFEPKNEEFEQTVFLRSAIDNIGASVLFLETHVFPDTLFSIKCCVAEFEQTVFPRSAIDNIRASVLF